MSGESIYGLYAKNAAAEKRTEKVASPYTGTYEKHMGEPTKPVYSTFFEKGKEYDGSNVRFFKQREAVIGKNVGESVDPQNYLKKGGGVRHVVPPVHEEKVYTKPPLDENFRQGGKGGADGNGARPTGADGAPVGYDEHGNPIYGDAGYGGGNGGDGANRDAGNRAFHEDTEGFASSADGAKNFVASNVVEMSNMVPKRRKEQAPMATSRKSFGQAPAYLSRVKGEVAQEKAFVASIEEAKQQRQQQVFSKYVHMLPRDEHQKLVADLQARSKECVSELQKMPYSKDTPSMLKRRTELERTIADIETALKKLDKDALFIYKDDPVNGQWAKEAALKEAQKYAAGSL